MPHFDFFIDIDGVLYDGNLPIEGGLETIRFIRSIGGRILLVTNTTRMSVRRVEEQLATFGYDIPGEEIFSVSQATLDYVTRHYGKARCFLITDDSVEDMFRQAGHTVIQDASPRDVDVVVIGVSKWPDFGQLDAAWHLIEGGAEAIAMHRDPTFPDGGIMRLGLGGIVAALESVTDIPITTIGKPNAGFFQLALAKSGFDPEHTIMVGDSLEADIRGARSVGLKTLFVRSGTNANAPTPVDSDWELPSISALPKWYRETFQS